MSGTVLQIIIMSFKVAIPTILLIFGVNLLIVSHSKWEAFVSKLVGVNDLEISKAGFLVLKVVALLLVLAALFIIYLLFIKDKMQSQASLPFSPRGIIAVANHCFGRISGISLC